ncbi:MATE family efflux transporter [Marinimicrobium locisalis]|uniref:MATE family efflux transporter n=1 Tax=Marinimicrobium locisalis TaxID=546022 RepID=UPI0032218124
MNRRAPAHRDIWQLAWPMMLSNLSIPLLGAVDTAILGHLPSPVYLGAVTVGGSLLSLLFWSFGFLRMGTTSVAARAEGANDRAGLHQVLVQSLSLALALALALMVIGPWLLAPALAWMGPSPEVQGLALEYARIRLWGAPASLMNFALVGWFIGRQDTRRPLAILFTTNGLNIVLDALLILGFGLNSEGAAWASVLAEYGGLTLGLWLVARTLHRLNLGRGQPSLLGEVTRWRAYGRLMRVNRHLFVRTLCLLSVFVFFAAQGARMGNHILAANAILLQFLLLTSYALDGFAHAAEALTGRAIGAGRIGDFHLATRRSTLWALGCSVLISAVFVLGAPWWPTVFTSQPEVLDIVRAHYVWVCLIPLVGVWGYQLDGIFLGSGQTAAMQYTVLIATGAVFAPLWWWLQPLGNQGLWLAFVVFNGARGALLGGAYYHLTRKGGWLAFK